mmetsp:Transcript_28077/g.70535  ORF Transcript_28077/g.70535 Transcript_28077/m.70535 type:complete len:226 (-) Transcript_28077:248-925(-)
MCAGGNKISPLLREIQMDSSDTKCHGFLVMDASQGRSIRASEGSEKVVVFLLISIHGVLYLLIYTSIQSDSTSGCYRRAEVRLTEPLCVLHGFNGAPRPAALVPHRRYSIPLQCIATPPSFEELPVVHFIQSQRIVVHFITASPAASWRRTAQLVFLLGGEGAAVIPTTLMTRNTPWMIREFMATVLFLSLVSSPNTRYAETRARRVYCITPRRSPTLCLSGKSM